MRLEVDYVHLRMCIGKHSLWLQPIRFCVPSSYTQLNRFAGALNFPHYKDRMDEKDEV